MGIELRLMHQSSSSFLNLSHVKRFRLSCWEWDWQWRFWHIVAIIFCVYLFQFSVYFVVSEMRVIWVISCISNSNIDQKRFAFAKAPQTRPHILAQFFALQKWWIHRRIRRRIAIYGNFSFNRRPVQAISLMFINCHNSR